MGSALICNVASALSPEAIEGKSLYPTCHVCHNPEANPPLGPPMWGVQRRYKNSTIDKDDFIESMVDFVKQPTLENAKLYKAVEMMGLMPPLPLPDDILKKIAAYIYEEDFAPPCTHWAIGAKLATENDDLEHAKKDQRMLEKFCN